MMQAVNALIFSLFALESIVLLFQIVVLFAKILADVISPMVPLAHAIYSIPKK
jgi:hypothetical protein